ncbi:hypothetical protein ACW9HQ_41360, partial [Nocardia gipuzkoensis]
MHLAGWRHPNPEFAREGWFLGATTIFELAAGVRKTADISGRVRFDPDDEWIQVRARWTRISGEDRPQALIDKSEA